MINNLKKLLGPLMYVHGAEGRKKSKGECLPTQNMQQQQQQYLLLLQEEQIWN